VELALYDHAGERIAVVHSSGDVEVRGAAHGDPLFHLPAGGAGGLNTVAFSADDAMMLTSHWNGSVRVWRVVDGVAASTLVQNHEPLWAARFSPDGRQVATASAAGMVRLWNTSTGQPVGSPLLGSFVDDLAFSPDGRMVAVADYESRVRLMDSATSLEIGSAQVHSSPVHYVGFAADGRSCQMAGHDRTLRRFAVPLPWSGNVEQVIHRIQALTGLSLDADGVVNILDHETWSAARAQVERDVRKDE
jgi:WD40 repeat protein